MVLGHDSDRFLSAPMHYVDVGSARIAYRRLGVGAPLILLHGWPFSSLTFRRLVPLLEQHLTCYALDLPGAGESSWTDATDFSFDGRARIVADVVERLALREYFIAAHDTGATIARRLALVDGGRLKRLAIIDTEIPGHRPPWIPLYRLLMALPGANFMFRQVVRSRWFVHSSLGFGPCFYDPTLLDGEFTRLVIDPIIGSPRRMAGHIRSLRGIDWSVVDGLAETHQRIRIPVLLVWGDEDSTFPVALAREMAAQFPRGADLRTIPGAMFVPHEEQPARVADALLDFFLDGGKVAAARTDGSPS
jgi:haloalkane dehalogenase